MGAQQSVCIVSRSRLTFDVSIAFVRVTLTTLKLHLTKFIVLKVSLNKVEFCLTLGSFKRCNVIFIELYGLSL